MLTESHIGRWANRAMLWVNSGRQVEQRQVNNADLTVFV